MSDTELLRSASPVAADWLESGTAIFGKDGILQWADAGLLAWVGFREQSLPEESLADFLARRNPDWREACNALVQSEEPLARASWSMEGVGGAPSLWFQVERLQVGEGAVFRMGSCLPPRSELAEVEWDAHLHSEEGRRQMFIRLMQAEARLEQLTGYWPGVVFSQRPDGSFAFISAKVQELTGVPPQQWERQSQWFWQVIHEADTGELEQQMQRAAQTGRPITSTFRVRHLQSGKISYILEHRQPIKSSGGLLLGYEGVWLDVTRQTIAERRLSAAAWKETLAVLTMGLAHDFGNIMAGIHSLSESFLEQLEPEHAFCSGLGLIKQNSMQASQLVHRIINLHVGRPGDRNYQDLNALLNELHDLVRKVVPRRIQVELKQVERQLPVYLDSVEFRQTLLNLALNAAESMPERGRIELSTSYHKEWPAPEFVEGVVPRLPCVCISVRDSGCGIHGRHLERIFDPFFTTKSANKGSGLGLYNARLFVEKHRGAISVESVEGQGSVFHLWLPEADFKETEREAEQETTVAARRLTLLLMAPAGRMQSETATLLRTRNYHVITVTTAAEVMRVLRAGDCICAALVMLIETDDADLMGLLDAVRSQQPMLRLILKLVGREREDLRPAFAKLVDLVVSGSAPEEEFLDLLGKTLHLEA